MREYNKIENRKYKAFTLSEVLITVVIIGIIAAITIPSILLSVEKRELESAYKKTFSSLSNLHTRLKADNGGTLEGLFSDYDSARKVFEKYFVGSKSCVGSNMQECWHQEWYCKTGSTKLGSESGQNSVILADGTIMNLTCLSESCTSNTELKESIGCVRVRADINGDRKPNRVGKDIFDFYITEDKVLKRGDTLTTTEPNNSCGWGDGTKIY